MSSNLRFLCIAFSIFIITMMILLMKKNKVIVKYSLIWLICFSVFLLLTLFPNLLNDVTKLLGFEVSSNMIFAIIIGILVLINIMLTVIVSTLQKKYKNIVQEISIINKK